jgi:hypothetical protein
LGNLLRFKFEDGATAAARRHEGKEDKNQVVVVVLITTNVSMWLQKLRYLNLNHLNF